MSERWESKVHRILVEGGRASPKRKKKRVNHNVRKDRRIRDAVVAKDLRREQRYEKPETKSRDNLQ